MKVVRRLVGTAIVTAVAMVPAASAEAMTFISGNCKVEFQAGEYGSTAFAKFRLAAGAQCYPGTWAQVEGNRGGTRVARRCDLWQPAAGCRAGGGWFQASIANASYTGSHLRICAPLCTGYGFDIPIG